MAQYQWTGNGETAGNAPTLFTNVWGGSLNNWTVQTDAEAEADGKSLVLTGGVSERRALQLDAAGSSVSGRIDVRGRVKLGSDTTAAPHFARMFLAGGDGTETNLHPDMAGGSTTTRQARINEYDNGTFNAVATETGPNFGPGWFRYRFLYDTAAANDIQLWVWEDADPEPGTPTITVASYTPPVASGGLGIGVFTQQETRYDWVTFGTGGDDAVDLKPAVNKGVTITLYDRQGSLQSSVTGITALWWNATAPTGAPEDELTASTDGSGVMTLDLTTSLSVGANGYLLLWKEDATTVEDSLAFAGILPVEDIS